MCEPTTIALVATSVLMAGTAIYAGQQQKKAAKAMAQQQQQQIDQSAQVESNKRQRAADAAAAQIRTSAAGSGVAGNSIAAMLDDVMFQSGQDISLIEKQRQWGIDGSKTELWARNQASTAAQIGGVTSAATTGLGSYQQYKIALNGE